MSAVLGKLKQLEKYVTLTGGTSHDPVLELALGKLVSREAIQLERQKARLQAQLEIFEQQYGMNTDVFYARFEQGELGDKMDFIEWAATCEMVGNLEKQLAALGTEKI